MIFLRTRVQGAFVIDLERRIDHRGYFARAWCQKEFEANRLTAKVAQVNVSSNAKKGTIRGMHYQVEPFQEAKTISCTRGTVWDVVLDLRLGSQTYLTWDAVDLSAENRRMLYVPEGCAHGFQTLTDDAELLYFMSEFYSPAHARGFRHDDSAFGISWPLPAEGLTEADRSWPDFQPSGR